MGKKLDEDLLNRALVASQLVKDLQNLKLGVETVIGERGINVSGGQKARISLARALYSEADIYLLDDPLSAVDPQVASSIFHDCIRGFLKGKLIVLVTHQLQFLTNVEKILVLKDGKQAVLGDFKAITESGFNIFEILRAHNDELQKSAGEKPDLKNISGEEKKIVK